MPQGRKTAIMVSTAIFMVMEAAAIAMLSATSTLQDIWINRASHRVMAALWGSGEKIRSYFSLETANRELALQNAALRQELSYLRQKETAAAEKDASAAPVRENFRYTPASIAKMSLNGTHNYVIVNKGSEDGIAPQSGIITSRGVIGVIRAVSPHYSYGLTLMNPDITVSVRVGSSGVTALLDWDGISSNGAVIGDIPPHYEIAPGDTVWTSGYSILFPADIPIGITGESRIVDGLAKQIKVKLFQDLSSTRYVTVTTNLDSKEISELEAAGTEGEDLK